MSNSTEEQPVSTSAVNAPESSHANSIINNIDTNHIDTSEFEDDENMSTQVMAKGISTMISSVIKDFDSKASTVTHSQDLLSSALHRLTSELDQLLEDAPLPFIMQHAAKLSNVRKRVSSLNSILRTIQRRVDDIDLMLSVGVPNDKTDVGGSKQLSDTH